jgi:adhesin transport system membrane fusion protein
MSRLDRLEAGARYSVWRRVAWTLVLATGAVVVWAYFAELEEVAVAQGEVVPQGQIKVIQHLEGGIIGEIFVTEGMPVSVGQPLLQLDRGLIGSTRDEVQIELDGLKLVRARLEAETTSTDLVFPADEAARRPDIVIAERQTFEGRRRELDQTLGVLREQVNQRELALRQVSTQLRSAQNNLALAQQKFDMSAELLAEGLTARIEHVQLEQEVRILEGEINELKATAPRAKAAIEEARKRIEEERSRAQRRALDELGELERDIALREEGLTRASNQFVRTEIKSPIDGVVQTMRHHTVGGVVRPGEPLMEIVPTQERLMIEARLDPTDIGYVRIGHPTVVKISTYDFSRYGGLDGTVISISPDSHVDPQTGQSFFKVIAETDRTYLGAEPGDLPISPGMEATIDIHTGEKSVIDYLIKPVIRAQSEAFRER